MNVKIFFVLLLASALVLSGCAGTNPPASGQVTNNENSMTDDDSIENEDSMVVGNFSVSITENGYEPRELTIKKGSTVTWTNNSSKANWPATAQHPTHTKYPGSDIQKCGTDEQGAIFDACKGLANGESFSFTFNEAGQWPYHEHVEAKTFGKIIVVE